MDRLQPSPHTSVCEWKGDAAYSPYVGADRPRIDNVAWSYPDPNAGYEAIRDHLAFYARPRRRGVGRRRTGDAAARPLLRRLGDVADRRADQGRAGLVSAGTWPQGAARSGTGQSPVGTPMMLNPPST